MEGGLDIEDDHVPPMAVAQDEMAPDNKFQKAIGAWRNIDLNTLIKELDKVASDIVSHQRDVLAQRKDLAQKTKEFHKLDSESKIAEYRRMFKAYQSFIDVVSTQSKTTQAAFFQVYSPLSEAPDPYPLLEASVDSLVTAEETVPKLTAENEYLQKTVSNLTAQLERAEKKLGDEAAARKALEESRDFEAAKVEAKWSAIMAEKQGDWEAKEKSLEEKVEDQEKLLKELKASYEVAERLAKGEEVGEDTARGATAAELEFVTSELERATHRLADVEARNEQLRVELAQAASAKTTEHVDVEDDPAFLRLRSENSSLMRKLESARHEKDVERSRLETATHSLERELTSLKSEKDALREKVQKWSDYENVKQELEVLKAIEFATGDDDNDDDEVTDLPTPTNAPTKGKETLEQLLLARNKKLGNELTVLRVSHQDLQARLEALQEELSTTNMELEKSRTLNDTLEADLEKVQQEATNAFDTMSVAGTYTSRFPQSSYGGGTRRGAPGRSTSPASSIISGFDPSHAAPSPGLNLSALRGGPDSSAPGAGILPMVTAQRDRFKKRNSELEAELHKVHDTVSALRSEIAALQKDNLDLYERTRYVSSYNRATGTSATAAASHAYSSPPTNGNPSTINVGSSASTNSGLTMDRYRSTYEANLSPFAAFRGRESQRVLRRMNVLEKGVWRGTKLVLANRLSRNLFALYCVGLHVLVFWMLFGEAGGAARVVPVPVAGPAAVDSGVVLREGEIPGRVDT